ncbi:hypothetical protein H4219_004590 [Mycoemilia scoparia]|uniref:Uncharacterized protein n=1 Tax=Mycoemilia scoparia TaxID=417184 RepID=A0A9W8DR38_9FUNG|nr:hypothetical protein H4219_004590 [Mycoemilia scoparia]
MDVELLKPTEQFKLDASQAISEAEDLAKQGNLDDSLKKLRTCMKKAPETQQQEF